MLSKKLFATAALALGLAAPSAHAVLIDLGQAGGNPANQESRLDRLNDRIDLYNADTDPDLPEAELEGSFKTDSDAGTSVDIDVTGWSYLVLKWANLDHYWYVGDASGVLTFTSTVFNQNDQPQDISGFSLFNPGDEPPPNTVSDSGATFGLLGLAVAMIAVVGRRARHS